MPFPSGPTSRDRLTGRCRQTKLGHVRPHSRRQEAALARAVGNHPRGSEGAAGLGCVRYARAPELLHFAPVASLPRAFAARKRTAAIEAIGRERAGFGVRPSMNPHLAALFPSSDTRFEVTHGQCSCDLVGLEEIEDEARIRRQYQKKGWSETKIVRALADRHRAREHSTTHGRRNETRRRFRELLAGQARELGSIRVFAHSYRGNQDQEFVAATRSQRVVAREFLLSHLVEDVLVEIVDEVR